MKLATFNTNSIRARLPIITEWLKQETPDILCLQETKVQDRDFPSKAFGELGYLSVFRGQKSYNGVAIISRLPAEELRIDLYDEGDQDARFISAKIGGIYVMNVYVPQGVAPGTEKFFYKLRWLKDLLAHIRANYDPDQPLLVTGDFNVALEDKDVFDPEGMKGEVGFHPDEQAHPSRVSELGPYRYFQEASNREGPLHFLGLQDS